MKSLMPFPETIARAGDVLDLRPDLADLRGAGVALVAGAIEGA